MADRRVAGHMTALFELPDENVYGWCRRDIKIPAECNGEDVAQSKPKLMA